MKVLLRRNVAKLGQIGEVVDVRDGYARNYLIPKRLAMVPSRANLKVIEKEKHDYLYWDYGHVRGEFKQAVRVGNWKGVRNKQGAPLELYDLINDEAEARNVAQQHPDIVSRIERIMKEAYTESPFYPISK